MLMHAQKIFGNLICPRENVAILKPQLQPEQTPQNSVSHPQYNSHRLRQTGMLFRAAGVFFEQELRNENAARIDGKKT